MIMQRVAHRKKTSCEKRRSRGQSEVDWQGFVAQELDLQDTGYQCRWCVVLLGERDWKGNESVDQGAPSWAFDSGECSPSLLDC